MVEHPMPPAVPSSSEARRRVHVRILRSPPSASGEPFWQEYDVPFTPGQSVTGLLWTLNEVEDGGLAYRVSCHRGICASCIMRINGKQRLGCVTEVIGDLQLEPALGTVIKDLVIEQA
jgi:succinate dehydrogenase/fumarate reductase-like Fe-S protein